MYNLLRPGYGYIPQGKVKTRIINSNEIVQEKIDEYNKTIARMHPEYTDEEEGELEFVAGLGELEVISEEPQVTPEELLEQAQQEAEQLLNDAKAQAEQIVAEAQSEAENLRMQAIEEGRQSGQAEGMLQAEEYLEEEKQKLALQKAEQDSQYQQMLDSMEPELADVVARVFEQVFQIQFAQEKDVLLYLIRSTIAGIDGTREFLIKVHSSQIVTVEQSLDEIRQIVGNGAQIDIVSDASLAENDCLIETNNGMYDCGVTTQLNNLIKELRAMSLKV